MAEASVYIAVRQNPTQIKQLIQLNALCTRRVWSLWCYWGSVVQNVTGSLLILSKVAWF